MLTTTTLWTVSLTRVWLPRSGANSQSAFLEITYHANNIYLHEIALHPDHDADDFKPPFSVAVKDSIPRPPTGPLSPPYANAIIQCVSSSDALIETFLDMGYVNSELSNSSIFIIVWVVTYFSGAKSPLPSPELSSNPVILSPKTCLLRSVVQRPTNPRNPNARLRPPCLRYCYPYQTVHHYKYYRARETAETWRPQGLNLPREASCSSQGGDHAGRRRHTSSWG